MQDDYDDIISIESFLSDYREREWIHRAACKGMDTNIFFPDRGENVKVKLARTVCDGCPVKKECREYGDMERYGFWGGTSVRRRQKDRTGRTTR
jgi:WhiB family transcriptional regulator, redox-sensing transcriptional regulator